MTHKQTQCQAVSIAERKTLWLTEMFSFRAGRLAYCSCPTIWGSMSSAERRKRASRLLSYNENRKRKTFPTRHFDLTADFWLRPLSAKQEINVMFEKKKVVLVAHFQAKFHPTLTNRKWTKDCKFVIFFFICLTLLNIFYRLSGLGHKRRRAYIQSFLKLLLLYLTRRHDKHGKCFKKYVKSLLNKNNVYCCLLVCLYCCLLEKWQTSHF